MVKEIDNYDDVLGTIKEGQSELLHLKTVIENFLELEDHLIRITNDLVSMEARVMGPTVPIEIVTGKVKSEQESGYVEQLDRISLAMRTSANNISNQLERLKHVL